MGRIGGISSFSTYELECIAKTHQRYPLIDKALVSEAFERLSCDDPLPAILYQIKILAKHPKPKE